MAKVEPVPCPLCAGQVRINLASAGCKGEVSNYSADCDSCGTLCENLGDNGRRDNATRGYNRWVRDETARRAGLPPPPVRHRNVVARTMVVPPRQDWERGYFCAVAVALRENGDGTIVRSMFGQGGDPTKADPEDKAVFREHGLMK